MGLWQLLWINAAVLVFSYGVLWAIAQRLKDVSFIDAWWPTGMAVLAWTSLTLAGAGGVHGWLLAVLCTLWAARLGGHLFRRWRRHGRERRYEEMLAEAREKRGWTFPLASLIVVFAPQAPLQLIVALPVQLGQIEAAPLGPLALAGAALAVFGTIYEGVADAQLDRFKADPDSKGKVLDTGLWRYSRHPNYFGEACVWWGLYMIAAETGLGAWSLASPLLITFLLAKGSGAPTVEKGMEERRPGYADYIRNTSSIIPWPPKTD